MEERVGIRVGSYERYTRSSANCIGQSSERGCKRRCKKNLGTEREQGTFGVADGRLKDLSPSKPLPESSKSQCGVISQTNDKGGRLKMRKAASERRIRA